MKKTYWCKYFLIKFKKKKISGVTILKNTNLFLMLSSGFIIQASRFVVSFLSFQCDVLYSPHFHFIFHTTKKLSLNLAVNCSIFLGKVHTYYPSVTKKYEEIIEYNSKTL